MAKLENHEWQNKMRGFTQYSATYTHLIQAVTQYCFLFQHKKPLIKNTLLSTLRPKQTKGHKKPR